MESQKKIKANSHLTYAYGLGNYHESESLPNILLKGRNSPQHVPYNLYTEQLSGSAFTTPRHANLHSWLYRIYPSVLHSEFTLVKKNNLISPLILTPPTQFRWDPQPCPKKPTTFLSSLFTMAANSGAAIHLYAATASMEKEFFYNADGEFLIVPQDGSLRFKTEMGLLDVEVGEIIVIPRGIKFQVELLSKTARGYICENFGSPFQLPELGIIGANGLANPRDFAIPIAHYEEKTGDFLVFSKFQGQLWQASLSMSPLNVVAWQGTYTPYKYNLNLFNTVNSVSFDHPDPSIFTVLTSNSNTPHVANVDFVIFPPRWVVAQDTFRPPYFHRNIMSEYMGLISGTYDAKETGFLPGGASLHNCMTAHGPDSESYNKAIMASSQPEYYDNTLAFMFESKNVWQLTKLGLNADFRQKNYLDCWQGLRSNFNIHNIKKEEPYEK